MIQFILKDYIIYFTYEYEFMIQNCINFNIYVDNK